MSSYQSIVENLLLETGAGRALLQLVDADGGITIVGEAVTGGMRQIRHDPPDPSLNDPALRAWLSAGHRMLAQSGSATDGPAAAPALAERYRVRARLVAPVVDGDALVGMLSVHDASGDRAWAAKETEAVGRAQAAAKALLDARRRRGLDTTKEDLRDAGIQAILDRVRIGLGVQRCTLRQNVSTGYAFPVTHESRAEGIWSLRGDFTIIQTGQPVIEKMLKERVQVIQHDTRTASDDPLFHVMLKHYGDMRSQIVTPLFREDALAGVLSIHSLKILRTWTDEETALAKSAARMLGLLVGATLA